MEGSESEWMCLAPNEIVRESTKVHEMHRTARDAQNVMGGVQPTRSVVVVRVPSMYTLIGPDILTPL